MAGRNRATQRFLTGRLKNVEGALDETGVYTVEWVWATGNLQGMRDQVTAQGSDLQGDYYPYSRVFNFANFYTSTNLGALPTDAESGDTPRVVYVPEFADPNAKDPDPIYSGWFVTVDTKDSFKQYGNNGRMNKVTLRRVTDLPTELGLFRFVIQQYANAGTDPVTENPDEVYVSDLELSVQNLSLVQDLVQTINQ